MNVLIIYNSNHNFPQSAIPVRHIYPPSHLLHKPEHSHKYDKLSHLPSFPKILIHKTSQYSTIHAICLLSQAKNKKIYQPSIQATAKRLAVPLPPYRHNLPHPNTAEYRTPHRRSLPHPNTAEYRTLSAQPFTSPTPPNTEIHIGTTSHIPTPQNTTTSQQPPVTTTKHSFKKSPRGVQRGRGFTAPLRFSLASQRKKLSPLPRKKNIHYKINITKTEIKKK